MERILEGTVSWSRRKPFAFRKIQRTFLAVPSHMPERQYKVGDRIRVNLHHGRIEEVVIRAVIQDGNETKLQGDVVGLDLTALIDTRQVVE